MAEVISVKFKDTGKDYYFDPNGVTAKRGQYLIVETSKGLEYALCSAGNHEVPDDSVVPPLRPVIRVATAEDNRIAEQNRQREEEALRICREKAAKHELDMKLISAEYSFDGSKLLFFFTSDGRVDFRDLVKELAGIFHTRIELRQIGVRDEARMLGGLGICGRPFCCASFLDDFQPVSIKMAKTQGLSLNPTKISGTCGRLMCCLKYEQDAYEELVKNVPKVDAFVDTPAGKGSVIDVDLLRSTVRVRLEDLSTPTIKTYDAKEVQVLGGKAKRAEYLAARAVEKAAAEEEAEARKTAAKARRASELRVELEKKAAQEQQSKNEQPKQQTKQAKQQPRQNADGAKQPPKQGAGGSAGQTQGSGQQNRSHRRKGSSSGTPTKQAADQSSRSKPTQGDAKPAQPKQAKQQPKQNAETAKQQAKSAAGTAPHNKQQGQSGSNRSRSRRRKPSGNMGQANQSGAKSE